MYLVAVLDWWWRQGLAWQLSHTLTADFSQNQSFVTLQPCRISGIARMQCFCRF
jgi:hypothetical protein